METQNFPRQSRVYIPLIGLFLIMAVLMPRSPKFNYDYKKGSPWMYETLIAQFDFPVLKSDAQLMAERDAAGAGVIPYYRQNPEVAVKAETAAADIDLGDYSESRKVISDAVSFIYSKGVISRDSAQGGDDVNSSGSLIYVQRGKRSSKVPKEEVLTADQASQLLRTAFVSVSSPEKADSLLNASGLLSYIVPDLIYDSHTTELVHEENNAYVSKTQGVGRSGQVIVNEGEIITAEIEQMLNSYKAEYDMNVGYSGPLGLQWAGNILISFILVLILFLGIYYCNYTIFAQYNKYLYLLLVFAISAVVSSLMARFEPSLFYLIPYTLISLYLLAFFKKRMVMTVYVISLLPILILAPNGVEVFITFLAAGVTGIFVFEYFNKGWLQFVTAFIVFVVMVLVWLAFRLMDGPGGFVNYHVIWNMALAAFMSVAGYPLIFLFEKIFSLVSTSKLVELSDTSNKLLRELADKAPGTFQHSLQVMNLADAAARSIGANVPLVRAGALYHDIGKMLNPQCFTENEAVGVKYHAGLTPQESAQEIIRHVSDGLSLAQKHGLPEEIQDFITTHHGTSSTGYFLTRYLNEGGDPDDVDVFHYNGKKPLSKEHVILMLCDAIEAASRSLKDYSKESISDLVENIVNGKSLQGQLSNADISLKEIDVVKDEIKTYLQQMYHSRIAYPKRVEKAAR